MIQFFLLLITFTAGFYCYYLKSSGKKNRTTTAAGILKLKSSWKWLDDGAFHTLTMICDTIAPNCEEKDITDDECYKKMQLLSKNFETFVKASESIFTSNSESSVISSIFQDKRFSIFLSPSSISSNRSMITHGCLKFNTHIAFAETIELMGTSSDKMKLYLLLSVLNTSIGCGLLTGIPCAFTDLSLYHREIVLRRLRDHYVTDLKGAFAILKKLIGTLFLSYTERYTKNILWNNNKYLDSYTTGVNQKATLGKLKLQETITLREDPVEASLSPSRIAPVELSNVTLQEEKKDDQDSPSISSSASTSSPLPKTMTKDELLREKLSFPSILKEVSYYHALRTASSAPPSPYASTADLNTFSPDLAYSAPSISDNSSHLITIDAVVVGSGAGGGVVANTLIEAGYDVLVLEKGGYYNAVDFSQWNESEAMANTFDKGGIQATEDGNILVLSGTCVGGGTTINWSASFPPPVHVRNEWVNRFGLTDFKEGGKYESSLAYVSEKLNVNTDNSYYDVEDTSKAGSEGSEESRHFVVNNNNRILWEGSRNLSYTPAKIPRNVKKCTDCGHCSKGCSYESKNSTFDAFLMDHLLAQYQEPLSSCASASLSACDSASTSSASSICDSSTSPISGCSTPSPKKKGRLYVLPDCAVTRVLTQGTPLRARGVEAIVKIYEPNPYNAKDKASRKPKNPSEYPDYFPNPDEPPMNPPQGQGLTRKLLSTHYLQVKSRVVVASCGSIQTPALLLRSNFKNDNIGRYLTLHPVVGAAGIFPIWEAVKKQVEAEKAAKKEILHDEESQVELSNEEVVEKFYSKYNDGRTGLSSGTSMGVVVHKRRTPGKTKKARREDATAVSHYVQDPAYDYTLDHYYPYVLETPPVHAGLLGLLLPWDNGLSYKVATSSYPNLAAFLVIQRDRDHRDNRVILSPSLPRRWRGNSNNKSLSKESNNSYISIISPHRNSSSSVTSSPLLLPDPNDWGQPAIYYKISKEDEASLSHGLVEAFKVLRAAGALMLFPGHNGCFPWHVEKDAEMIRNQLSLSHRVVYGSSSSDLTEEKIQEIVNTPSEDFEKYLSLIKKQKISSAFSISCFSAHQMSSCRMHASPQHGAINPQGRLHECLGLYVADGSSLPTALGVNPMLTIESVAHLISRYVVEELDRNDFVL